MRAITDHIDRSRVLSQFIPLVLTVIVLAVLIAVLRIVISILNLAPFTVPILLQVRWIDVLVGLTIYLKTSIDFAIFIGRLMSAYPGWRGRIAIEIGTALGNAAGTILIIALWVALKHVDLLLAAMVFIAALVLFELASGSMEHLTNWETGGGAKSLSYSILNVFLRIITKFTDPVLSRIMPDLGKKLRGNEGLPWRGLLTFSMTVPFILGLDDFAGYVPLFNVVNIFGFSIGVFAGHTLLNIFLFVSPERTIQAVKNEVIAFLGAVAFIALAFYGIIESGKIVAGILTR